MLHAARWPAAKKFADIETEQLFAAGECGPSCKETKTLQNRTGLKHGYHSSNLLNALLNMGSWVRYDTETGCQSIKNGHGHTTFWGWLKMVWRQEGHLACKNWVVTNWRSYLSRVRCKWFAYGPTDATATPSSLAPLKSRMIYLSGARLPRLSWKNGR